MASEAATAPRLDDLDLATFDTAWPAIVAQVREVAGPRRHALIKEATPSAVEHGVVTLEIPAHLPFHLEQLREDSELHEVFSRAAADVLGGSVGLVFVAAPDEPESEPSVERAPDKDELLTAEAGDGNDPEDLVVDLLGGEIVGD